LKFIGLVGNVQLVLFGLAAPYVTQAETAIVLALEWKSQLEVGSPAPCDYLTEGVELITRGESSGVVNAYKNGIGTEPPFPGKSVVNLHEVQLGLQGPMLGSVSGH